MVVHNELDDFIDEIDDTIEANTLEKPLSKGVSTQHGINQRPSEMTPEMYAILTGESDAEVEYSAEVRAMQVIWVTQARENLPLQSAVDRLQEGARQLAELPGLDTSTLVSYSARLSELRCNNRGYKMECQDCNFRFRSNDVDAINLAKLHANRNQHRVSFKFGFFGRQYDLEIQPEKPKWRERLKRWAVCLGIPVLVYVGVLTGLEQLSWWRVGGAGIGALIGFNLYEYWQNRKGDKNQE